MGVPRVYRKSGEKAIASYNFEDVVSGTGIIKFYGCQEANNSGESYFLTPNLLYSNNIGQSITIPQGSATKLFDLDFDVKFGTRRILTGDVFANIPIRTIGGADTKHTYVIVKIRKWDGTTETDITSKQSETYVDTTKATGTKMFLIRIPITTDQVFKKGESLRVTVEYWSVASGTAQTLYIYHDPQGRGAADTNTPSTLIIQTAFNIDI